MATIIVTPKGRELLEYEGFTFWRRNRNFNCDRWYCSSRSAWDCRVILRTLGPEVIEKISEHNHQQPVMLQDKRGRYRKIRNRGQNVEYVDQLPSVEGPYTYGPANCATIIITCQGTKLLQYEGHTFWRANRNFTCDRWYCSSRSADGCKVVLKCMGLEVLDKKFEHNHPQPIMVQDKQGRYSKLKSWNNRRMVQDSAIFDTTNAIC